MKKFECEGKRYAIIPHDDGIFSLSEDGSPTPLLAAGTWDQVKQYIQNKFSDHIQWID